MELASGRYDALSGRFVTVADNLDQLLQATASVDREQLYTLRVNRLSPPVRPAPGSIADASTGPAGLTLRVERVLPLSLEDAFAAWIDPTAVARWFIHAAEVQWVADPMVEARPGGSFRFHVVGAAGEFDFAGSYREITSPTRLEFTWRWQSLPMLNGPGDTSVVVELERSKSGTRVALVQTHLPDEAALEAHRRGWERCLDGIGALNPPLGS